MGTSVCKLGAISHPTVDRWHGYPAMSSFVTMGASSVEVVVLDLFEFDLPAALQCEFSGGFNSLVFQQS